MTKERIIEFIKYQQLTTSIFLEKTGIKRGFLDSDKLNQAVSDKHLTMIIATFPNINVDWLLTGQGPMLRKDLPVAHPVSDGKGIPLIPINAMAGAFTGEQHVLELECDRYVVPAFKEAEFLITVKGSSMIPKYNSGDIVACKRLPIDTFFQWNKVYVLDTEQGPLIKRVKQGTNPDTLSIHSDNPNYEPFELHRSCIFHIALVVGVIRLE